MRFSTVIVVAATATILAGCMTEAKFEQAQTILSGSPALKRDAIDKCITENRRRPEQWKANVAKVMNVSMSSDVARTFCIRAINGVASGRITYDDVRTKSPRLIRVIQGR